MGLLGLYFQPAGRISRGRFWFALAGWVIIEAAFNIWLDVTLWGRDIFNTSSPALTKPALQLDLLVNLIFLFPLFVILAKRFHDRNRSAAWAVPFVLANIALIVGGIVGLLPLEMPQGPPPTPSVPAAAIGLFWLFTTVWILVELGFLRGTPGVNRYGPDPLPR